MVAKVSIVLPAYNHAHYLPAALDSIFLQYYSDFELIVVNDGSTDNTASVLDTYQGRYPFTVVTQENQGLPGALNAGFAKARGQLLTWTSADNEVLPEMLLELVKALERYPEVGLVYADFFLMDDATNTLGLFEVPEYDPYWLLYANFVHCCFLYRRECLDRVGGYDPTFIYSEDWEYWIRISEHYPFKRVPLPLYRYRIHQVSMTGELKRGTAKRSLAHRDFSARIRRRMPMRWLFSRLKRAAAMVEHASNPYLDDRRQWLGWVERAG
jgi:glycosyltransferase involved in cell wall biosynthesis